MADEVPNKCIVCWIAAAKLNAEQAACYILGEATKYPYYVDNRFNCLCHKHAKVSFQQGQKSKA
jgi:hypothetical protein